MPDAASKPFRVFYSWQSDLPKEGNERLIRAALDAALAELNGDHDLHLNAARDEATRDLPGSPNIAEAIFAKIRQAEVFVCDLSKVAEVTNEAGERRNYCNPNVAIELGYAIRVLGWERIVLVFNTAYGKLPDDLPFDARGHRTLPFTCKAAFDASGKPTSECKAAISNAKGHLRTGLLEALKHIAQTNPKRPEESDKPSPEQIKRERDVEQLRKMFRWINLGALDRFVYNLGNSGWLTNEGHFLWERLGWLIGSSKFYLSDEGLRQRLITFMKAWGKCFTHFEHMDQHRSGQVFFFNVHDGDEGKYIREQNKREKFNGEQAAPLKAALDAFIGYVKEHYLEIDPDTAGAEGLAEYKEEEAETKRIIRLSEEADRHS
ncbi:MAG: hypothetical protein U1F81_01055 [Verrucomicrobiaceae bacterium]